jgi:hypothetical protein
MANMFRRGQLLIGAFALALVTNAAWSCGGGEPATASSSASSGALGGDPSLGGAGGVAMSGGSGGAMSGSGGLGGTAPNSGAGGTAAVGTAAGGANAGGAGSGGAPPMSTLLAANVQVVMTGTGTAFARAVAVDPSDAVIVAGTFSGSIDFGGGPITSNGDDVFVAKYDDNGNHLWSSGYGDGQPDNVGGIACDAAGNIIITGSFLGQLGFGGALLNASGNQFSDVYVAKLDALGGHVWSKRFGDLDSQEGHDVAVGPSNEIVITGLFGSTIDFGGSALSTKRFSPSTMARVHSHRAACSSAARAPSKRSRSIRRARCSRQATSSARSIWDRAT